MSGARRTGAGRPRSAGRPKTPARRYRIAPGIAHREVAGQTLLLGAGAGMLYSLNATGQVVWRCLQRRRTVPETTAAVARAFGVPRSRAGRDVHSFLETLVRRGFLIRA
jgi:hypothetical protein